MKDTLVEFVAGLAAIVLLLFGVFSIACATLKDRLPAIEKCAPLLEAGGVKAAECVASGENGWQCAFRAGPYGIAWLQCAHREHLLGNHQEACPFHGDK